MLCLWKACVACFVSHCVVVVCVTHIMTTQWLTRYDTHAFPRGKISWDFAEHSRRQNTKCAGSMRLLPSSCLMQGPRATNRYRTVYGTVHIHTRWKGIRESANSRIDGAGVHAKNKIRKRNIWQAKCLLDSCFMYLYKISEIRKFYKIKYAS
jgi:hypothetical protein